MLNLTQEYIDAKYADWQGRLSPELAAALRDNLQTRFEMQNVENELACMDHGVPMLSADSLAAFKVKVS
jgi:hypothetical protein